MAILLCGILDGMIETPLLGSLTLVENGMTAIGYGIEDVTCLHDKAALKQLNEHAQKINAAYFAEHTIVPLTFGTLVNDENEVRQFLINARIQLKALMDKVRGKDEIIIQISFDVHKVLAEIAKKVDATDPLALGKAFFELSQKYKKDIAERLQSTLSTYAADAVETPSATKTVILIMSYLVEKDKKEAFDAALDAVAEQCDDLVLFKYVGPLPPSSFVTTAFNTGDFDLITQARLLLDLKEQCTVDEVKANYRKISLRVHPDRNNGDDTKMKELAEAYRIVKAYCGGSEGREISFTKEAVEQSFVPS